MPAAKMLLFASARASRSASSQGFCIERTIARAFRPPPHAGDLFAAGNFAFLAAADFRVSQSVRRRRHVQTESRVRTTSNTNGGGGASSGCAASCGTAFTRSCFCRGDAIHSAWRTNAASTVKSSSRSLFMAMAASTRPTACCISWFRGRIDSIQVLRVLFRHGAVTLLVSSQSRTQDHTSSPQLSTSISASTRAFRRFTRVPVPSNTQNDASPVSLRGCLNFWNRRSHRSAVVGVDFTVELRRPFFGILQGAFSSHSSPSISSMSMYLTFSPSDARPWRAGSSP